MPAHDTHGVPAQPDHGVVGLQRAPTNALQASGAPPALGDVVQWFKTMTTNAYIRGVRDDGWTAFERRLWQRDYYDRVVRNDRELRAIREYVANKPAQWTVDEENPNR